MTADPEDNMAPAPKDRVTGEPDQQDAGGLAATSESSSAEESRDFRRLWVPGEVKASVEKFAERCRDSGYAKAFAIAGFMREHGKDITYSTGWVSDIFNKVYHQPSAVGTVEHDQAVQTEVEKLRIRAEARETFDRERRGRQEGLEVVMITDLLEQPDPEWLIPGLLPEVGTFQLYGDSNTGKSFVMLDLLMAIASGERFLDAFDINKYGAAVYFAGEGSWDLKFRVQAWIQARSGVMPDEFYPQTDAAIDLRSASDVDDAIELCHKVGAIAVVFDTLAMHLPGGNESSAQDMGMAVNSLVRMSKELGALVGTVHHTGKNPDAGARGSSAGRGAWDVEFKLSGTSDGAFIEHTKARGGPKHELIGVAMESVDLGGGRSSLAPYRVNALGLAASQSLADDERVLAAIKLKPGMTTQKEIAKAAKIKNEKVGPTLRLLQQRGLIAKDGRGWQPVEDNDASDNHDDHTPPRWVPGQI